MVVPKSGGGTKTTTKKATTSKSSTSAKKPAAKTSNRKNDDVLKKRLKKLLDNDSGSSSKGNLNQKEFEEIRDLLSTSDVQQFILNTAKKEQKAGTSKSTTPFKKVDKNKNSTAKPSAAKKSKDCPDGSCPLVRKSTTATKKSSSCPDGSCPLVKKSTTATKKATATKRKATSTSTKTTTATKKPRKTTTAAKKTTGKSTARKACGPCGSRCGCSSSSGGGCGCGDDDSYSDDSEDDDDDEDSGDTSESGCCSSCDYSDTDTDDGGCNGGACGRQQKPTNGKAKGGNNKNNRHSSGSWETESDSNGGYSNSNGRRRDAWQSEDLDLPIDTSMNLKASTWQCEDVKIESKMPYAHESKTGKVKPADKLSDKVYKSGAEKTAKAQNSQPHNAVKKESNNQIRIVTDNKTKTAKKTDKNQKTEKHMKKAEASLEQVAKDKKIVKTEHQDINDQQLMDGRQNENNDKTMKHKKTDKAMKHKKTDKAAVSSAEIVKKESKVKDKEKAAKQEKQLKLKDKKSKKNKKAKENATKENAGNFLKSKSVIHQTEENAEKTAIETKTAKQKSKSIQKPANNALIARGQHASSSSETENDFTVSFADETFDFSSTDSSDDTYELAEEEKESDSHESRASSTIDEELSTRSSSDDEISFGNRNYDDLKYLISELDDTTFSTMDEDDSLSEGAEKDVQTRPNKAKMYDSIGVSHKQILKDGKISKTGQRDKNGQQRDKNDQQIANKDKSIKKKEKLANSAKIINKQSTPQGKDNETKTEKQLKLNDKKSKKIKKAEEFKEKAAKENAPAPKDKKSKTAKQKTGTDNEKTKTETKKLKQNLKSTQKHENYVLIPYGQRGSQSSQIENDLTVSFATDFWSTDSSDETYELEEEASEDYDSDASWCSIEEEEEFDSDYLDNELDESIDSSEDDDYHLPEGVEENVLVRPGEAKIYDANEDIEFDSDASSAQIFELSNDEQETEKSSKSEIESKEFPKKKLCTANNSNKKATSNKTQSKKSKISKNISTTEDDSSEESDDSCPQLVPIEANYNQTGYDESMEYSTDYSITSSESSEDSDEELSAFEPAIIKAGKSVDTEESYLDISTFLQSETDSEKEKTVENNFKHPLDIIVSESYLSSKNVLTKASTLQPISTKSKRKAKKRKLENVTLNEAENSVNLSIKSVESKYSEDVTFSNDSFGSLNVSSDTNSNDSTMPESIRPKFYNSLSTYQVILHLKADICIHGTLKVKLLAGNVNILGYDLKLGETVEVFSPRGNNLLSLNPIDSQNSGTSKNKLLEILNGLNKDFVETDFREIAEEYDNQTHAILLLERSDHSKRVSMVRKYMKEDIFYRSNTSQSSPYIQSQFLLRCGFFTHCLNNIRIEPSWNFVHLSESSKLLVVGGKGVGKSTFVRYTINKNLHKFEQFLLIDLDIGQPEAFIPQTISATVISKPILGPGYFYGLTPTKAYLFGDINVVIAPHSYLSCMKELFKYCHRENRFKNIPWIINTMGYTQGFGAELMSIIVECLQPTDVVQLQSVKQYANFEFPMNAENVRLVPRNIYIDEPRHDVFDYSLHVIDSIVTFEKPDKMQIWRMSPQEVRLAMVIAMLGGLLSEKDEWLTDVKPYRVSIDNIKIVCPGDYTLSKQDLLDVINANIVYLCDDSNSTMECYGIGIVRGVDKYQQAIYLLPSVPPQTLIKVNTLVICQIPLPALILLNQGPKIKGLVPYTYNTNDFIASKHVPRRVYRTKNFQQVNKVLLDE